MVLPWVDIIKLIGLIIAAAGTITVIVVAIIHYKEIIAWFQKRNDLKVADKENIAFTLKQKLETGDYKVIQGIFNQRTEDILEGRAMQSEKLDQEFEEAHEGKELLIYE